jgi:hypothetical protein
MRLDPPTTGPSGRASLRGGLAFVRSRLRFQLGLDGAGAGGWVGVALSAAWLGGWLLRILPLPHPALLLIPIAAGLTVSTWLAVRGFRPTDTDLALVVDRLLGSREAVVTSLDAPTGGLGRRVHHHADRALKDSTPILKQGLPLRLPPSLRALPLGLLLVAMMLWIPRAPARLAPAGPAGDPSAEAASLQERKDALERELGVELPEDLDAEFGELVEAMKRGGDAEALSKQADELADKLERHRQALSEGGAAQALKEAANALAEADGDAAQDLEDAAQSGDLDAAKEAMERMRERMENKPEKEREQAARELEKAADRAAAGGMDALSDALKEEAEAARQSRRGGGGGSGQSGEGEGAGQQGSQGGQQGSEGSPEGGQQGGQQGNQQGGDKGSQGGQQGSGQQQGQGGGAAGEGGGQQSGEGGQQEGGGPPGGQGGGMGEYLEQLGQQGLGGDGLAQEQKQMDLSQGLGQALGGAAGRVGPGQGGQGGGDTPGSGWGAGTTHTDEDKGQHANATGFQDRDRQVEGRTSSWTTEFGQDHDEQRLDGVKALATSVDVPLGEGPVDIETLRLRGSDERSGEALLQAPPGYREAAEEAIQGEAIPRHYRDQVKDYFDAIR